MNILKNYSSARYLIYVAASLALAALAAWKAADGNWVAFTISLLGTVQSLMAAANVNPDNSSPTGFDPNAFVNSTKE